MQCSAVQCSAVQCSGFFGIFSLISTYCGVLFLWVGGEGIGAAHLERLKGLFYARSKKIMNFVLAGVISTMKFMA